MKDPRLLTGPVLVFLINGVGVDDEVNNTEEEIDQRVDIVGHTLDYVERPAVLRKIFRPLISGEKEFPSDLATAV